MEKISGEPESISFLTTWLVISSLVHTIRLYPNTQKSSRGERLELLLTTRNSITERAIDERLEAGFEAGKI
jgi:hypothetical protein